MSHKPLSSSLHPRPCLLSLSLSLSHLDTDPNLYLTSNPPLLLLRYPFLIISSAISQALVYYYPFAKKLCRHHCRKTVIYFSISPPFRSATVNSFILSTSHTLCSATINPFLCAILKAIIFDGSNFLACVTPLHNNAHSDWNADIL